ncbi:hypothetical protein ACIQUB_29555 [Rhizobium sp. NPDC090275]
MTAEFISVSSPNASNDLNPLPDAPSGPLFAAHGIARRLRGISIFSYI